MRSGDHLVCMAEYDCYTVILYQQKRARDGAFGTLPVVSFMRTMPTPVSYASLGSTSVLTRPSTCSAKIAPTFASALPRMHANLFVESVWHLSNWIPCSMAICTRVKISTVPCRGSECLHTTCLIFASHPRIAHHPGKYSAADSRSL